MNKTNTLNFIPFDQQQAASITSFRAGETKLGERIQFKITDNTKFVILGVSEDIGPRANYGNGGAQNAFNAFLAKFLNMQSNVFLSGENITILGEVRAESNSDDISKLREQVSELDDLVIGTLSKIDFSNKQLIVVGGGHNNAYPIMKALSEEYPELHILNIDPHADCRPLEGRHSGNPFSTAITEEVIASYTVLGLHEQYNSKATFDFLETNNCDNSFYENYLDGRSLGDDLKEFVTRKGHCFGLEIDLDSIENMPTSAFTPSGFSLKKVRKMVRVLGSRNPIYLHLPEGAPETDDEKSTVGKALAYLVTDFIKSSTK